MVPSKNCLDLIKQFEGFSNTAYQDIAGNQTIGYGHLIKYHEEAKYKTANLSKEVATTILESDVEAAVKYLNNLCNKYNVCLNQNQFDALISLIFNIGALGNTMITYFKNKDITAIGNEITAYCHVRGKIVEALVKRRTQEKELFFS